MVLRSFAWCNLTGQETVGGNQAIARVGWSQAVVAVPLATEPRYFGGVFWLRELSLGGAMERKGGPGL